MYNLIQFQKKNKKKKKTFNCLVRTFTILKGSYIFLATFQAFFLFLPTKELPQLKSTPLTEACITHYTSNRAKISCHNMRAFRQCRRIWSFVSSFALYILHLLGILNPLFQSWSRVNILSQVSSQAKKLALTRA